MTDRHILRLLVFVPALLLHGFCPAAQDGAEGREPLTVTVEITASGEGEKQGLHDLFLESLRLELELAGFRMSGTDDPDVLIRGRYAVSGDLISFSLSAELPEEGRILFSVSSTEKLRFALDSVLLEHARRLVESVVEYRRSNSDRFKETSVESGGPKAAEEEAPHQSPEAAGPVSPHPSGGFVFAVDGGIFLAAGEGGRYLSPAFAAAFFGGYRLFPGMSAGLTLGGMIFRAEGYDSQAAGFIVLAGPSLRLKGEAAGRFVPGLRAEAGAALFSVSPENGADVRRVLPYAETGMTTDLRFGRLTLEAAVDLTLFYDGGALLYGFTPRLGLEF
jgi:hypothetical protein